MDYFEIIVEVIAAVAAAVSAVFAAVELHRSRKANEKSLIRERKEATIEAFNELQKDVLDFFVDTNTDNYEMMIKYYKDSDCKKAYNDTKALIARLEHFAVGINENIFDFEVFDKLGGIHIMYLYEKVLPIIRKANSAPGEEVYSEFTKLYERLTQTHKKQP